MDPQAMMAALEKFGIISVCVFLAIALWYKDRQLTKEHDVNARHAEEVNDRLMKIVQDKTTADLKLEVAIDGLRGIIDGLRNIIVVLSDRLR